MSKTTKPIIALAALVLAVDRVDMYPYQETPNDRYWSGGVTPQYYTWDLTISVSPQSHSSYDTRESRVYNGLDIFTGMWIADRNGRSLKIVTVIEKTQSSAIIRVEDVDRVNTFSDPSRMGIGAPSTSEVLIFEVDDESMPLLSNVPTVFNTANFVGMVQSRFQRWNPARRYKINKPNHDFSRNDVVIINQKTNQFEKPSINNKHCPVIGVVLESYRHSFFVSPVNRIVTGLDPALPGKIGDYIYSDPDTGKYTNSPSNQRLFVKLTESVPSFILGQNDSPELIPQNKFILNEVEVIVPSDSVDELINEINSKSEEHSTIATKVDGATIAASNISDWYYGVTGAILPVSARINGQLVTITTDTMGSTIFGPGMANEDDIATDINAANIPNISATASNGVVIVRNNAGGNIEIENVTPDGSGNNFAGVSSCTGLPLSTASSGDSFKIQLERKDGGAITIHDVVGETVKDAGLFSVQNGKLPEGMVVENWNRVGDTYVVDTIADRDNIFPIYTGDAILVLDGGNGEWVKFMYVNGEFIITATQDSARTDADVLTLTLTHENEAGKYVIGTLSDNSRVIDISVKVRGEFNIDALLNVGDSDVYDRIISDDVIDLTREGVYSNTPSFVYKSGQDTDIIVDFDPAGSESGEVKIVISYT